MLALPTPILHGQMRLAAQNEVDGADQAQTCPDVVELERLLHVEHGKRREDGQGEAFLQDLDFRRPYQAIVMNTFDSTSRPTVWTMIGICISVDPFDALVQYRRKVVARRAS